MRSTQNDNTANTEDSDEHHVDTHHDLEYGGFYATCDCGNHVSSETYPTRNNAAVAAELDHRNSRNKNDK